jgi:Na+-driven multidrug efflux pump
VFEIVTFVGMMVTVGTSVLFATELGALHLRRAKGYFTLGMLSAVAFGLLFAVVLALVRTPVIASFGASQAVSDMAASYWLWFLPAAALQPVAFFLGAICYTDGDARLSFCSYIAQLLGNCLLSVPLTMAFGAAGCAVGTGLGSLAAVVVLLFHFRKKGCMLGWSRHFVLSDLLRIFRMSFGDASKNIGKAVLMFALNAYVIAHFGSDMLPVLAVVVMTIGISEMFDGVANAAQPLASVYIGEKNPLLTMRVMRAAFWASLAEGGGVMLLLLAFPNLMLMLVGIDSPATVPEACFAVRAVSAALLGLAIVLLFNSYYVFIGREKLSAIMTLLAVLGLPVATFPLFGSVWGAHGVWFALGLSPALALGFVALYVLARGGRRGFPFLLPHDREGAIRVFDLDLDPATICGVSASVGAHLGAQGVDGRRVSKASLLVEEALMVVHDRNSGKRIKAEVTVDLNDGLMLVLRDDGEIFNITDADARVSSLRGYLVSNLMTVIPSRRNLTTTGFNRNIFKL